MEDFTPIMTVSPEETLRFFTEQVDRRKVTGATPEETLYVASILARYAMMSKSTPMAPPVSLYQILDKFILPSMDPKDSKKMEDPVVLELAGSQTLLLNGFFRDQMKRRHNVRWYDKMGRGFFERASDQLTWGEKAFLLGKVAEHFSLWTVACSKVNRMLREKRYLLRLV